MIVIGRIHIGAILPEWLNSYEALQKPVTASGAADWVTLSALRMQIDHARNFIVRETLQSYPDATHLFFVDDDVCVPADGLMRLLADNVPVMTGLYIQRGDPHLPVVYRQTPAGRHVNLTQFCAGLQEIDACGAGCLLIRTEVLRAIADTGEPWFDWPASGISEDLAFCGRVKRLGYPIALDFGVKCTHYGMYGFTYEHFTALASNGIAYANDEIAAVSQEIRPWRPTPVEAVP